MIEILRLSNVCKHMDKMPLRRLNCYFMQGEVVSIILRSNTLKNAIMDLISGIEQPDSGHIYFDDRILQLDEQRKVLGQNVYCIRKSGGLIDNLSVANNIFLNRNTRLFSKDTRPFVQTAMLLEKYGLKDVTPTTKVEKLPYATKHIIECIKAVANSAKLILADDFLNRYTQTELQRFEQVVQQIVGNNISFCFFSNSYGDMTARADRVIVIREGAVAANIYGREVSNKDMVIAAVTGTLNHSRFSVADQSSIPVCNNTDSSFALIMKNVSNGEGLHNLNLKIQKNSITGFFDISSDLEVQLTDILLGRSGFTGDLFLDGLPYKPQSNLDAISKGICTINANADHSFAMLNMDLTDNVTLMMPKSIAKFGLESKETKRFMADHILRILGCEHLREEYPENKPLGYVNRRAQMEIAVSRMVCAKTKLILMVNPMAYYDDSNAIELHKLLQNACRLGVTFIVFSSSICKLTELCDRVIPLE